MPKVCLPTIFQSRFSASESPVSIICHSVAQRIQTSCHLQPHKDWGPQALCIIQEQFMQNANLALGWQKCTSGWGQVLSPSCLSQTLDLNISWCLGFKTAMGSLFIKDWGCLAQFPSLSTFGIQNLRHKACTKGNVTWQLCHGSSVSHMMKNLVGSCHASLNPEALMCARLPLQTPCQKVQGLFLYFHPSKSWFKLNGSLPSILILWNKCKYKCRAFNWDADLLKLHNSYFVADPRWRL